MVEELLELVTMKQKSLKQSPIISCITEIRMVVTNILSTRTGWQIERQTVLSSFIGSRTQKAGSWAHQTCSSSSSSSSSPDKMEEAKLHLSSGESSRVICFQVLPAYLLAGLGMVTAGMLLDQVQVSHHDVLKWDYSINQSAEDSSATFKIID